MPKRIKTGNGWPHDVTKNDLEIIPYKGTGAGGQKKNKTSSAIMIKHIPTGLFAKCEEYREQSKNKQKAFRKLAEQLIPIMKNEVQKERYASGFDRIRTYNEKYQQVIDERINHSFSYTEILDGDLDEMLNLLYKELNHE